MLAFGDRFLSTVKVSWASSIVFATIGTTITALVLLPLLEILFSVLMGNDLGSPDLVRTGYGAGLVALCLSVLSGIVATIARQRTIGVFFEIHTFRRFDLAYWLAIIIAPTVFSLVTALVSLGGVFIFDPTHDLNQLGRTIVLLPVALCCGILLGIAASGIGVNLSDPYLGATIAGVFLPVLAGVIVPATFFPTWLELVSLVAPMRGTLNWLSGTGGIQGMLFDVLIAAIWAGIGIATIQRALIRTRAGIRFDTL